MQLSPTPDPGPPDPSARSVRLLQAACISYLGFAGLFLSSVLASRLLGIAGKGVFSVFMATVSGLWIVATFGIPQGQLYRASKDSRWLTHVMSNAWGFSSVAGGAVGLLYFVGGKLVGFAPLAVLPWRVCVLGVLAVPAGVLLIYQRQFFLMLRRFELAKAAGALLLTLPAIGYGTLYFLGRATVTSFAAVFLGSQVCCYLIFAAFARRVGPPQRGFSRELAVQSFSFGYRQFASDLALYLAQRLDFFLVVFFLGPTGLGIYSVAVALAEITGRLSNEIGTMLFPIFAEGEFRAGQPAAALRLMTLFAAVVAVCLCIVAGPLIRMTFGTQFESAVPVFRILLIGSIAWSTNNVTWAYISATGKPEYGVAVFGVVALVDAVLDVLFVPTFGITAAALSATVSYVVGAGLFLLLFTRTESCTVWQALVVRRDDLNRLHRVASRLFRGLAHRVSPFARIR